MSVNVQTDLNIHNAYSLIVSDLNSYAQEIGANISFPLATIKAIYLLYLNRENIANISDEEIRKTYIKACTSLLVETGFCPGTKKDQLLKNINEKVNLLFASYFFAKEHKALGKYFSEAFQSDPCFNGRINRLLEYQSTCVFQNAITDEQFSSDVLFVFYQAMENFNNSYNRLPSTCEEFLTWLQGQIDYGLYKEETEKSNFFHLYAKVKEAFEEI